MSLTMTVMCSHGKLIIQYLYIKKTECTETGLDLGQIYEELETWTEQIGRYYSVNEHNKLAGTIRLMNTTNWQVLFG